MAYLSSTVFKKNDINLLIEIPLQLVALEPRHLPADCE